MHVNVAFLKEPSVLRDIFFRVKGKSEFRYYSDRILGPRKGLYLYLISHEIRLIPENGTSFGQTKVLPYGERRVVSYQRSVK